METMAKQSVAQGITHQNNKHVRHHILQKVSVTLGHNKNNE